MMKPLPSSCQLAQNYHPRRNGQKPKPIMKRSSLLREVGEMWMSKNSKQICMQAAGFHSTSCGAMTYLVDTDYVADYLKGYQRATDVLTHLVTQGIGVSIITFAEVYEGIYYGRNRHQHGAG